MYSIAVPPRSQPTRISRIDRVIYDVCLQLICAVEEEDSDDDYEYNNEVIRNRFVSRFLSSFTFSRIPEIVVALRQPGHYCESFDEYSCIS